MIQLVADVKKLSLEVYTIGYQEQGESQIVLIKDLLNNFILFSCVIDCYSTNEINKTIEILDSLKIASLDYLIWTHPDEDHSVGIDQLVSKFCTASSKFLLPEGLNGNENDLINYNDDVKKSFDAINSLNKNQNYCVNTASVPIDGSQMIISRTFRGLSEVAEVKFSIIALAPISPLIRRRLAGDNVVKKNDFSIATLFRCGDLSLLFSGDIENQTIRQIPSFFFKHLNYLKTPHHTSKYSNLLLEKLDECFDGHKIRTAISTTFRVHKLPDKDLIKEYSRFVDSFHSTGEEGKHGFGFVKTAYNIVSNKLFEELHYGDAHKVEF